MPKIYPVVIIGGGPIGLAAAAHLLQRDKEFVLLEMGARIGDSVADWGHVQMFSSWSLNTDSVAVQMLSQNGWKQPDPDKFPTGDELVSKYLEPLANLPGIAERIFLNRKVRAVARQRGKRLAARSDAPFVIDVMDTQNHALESLCATTVIDASGTWKTPSPLGGFGFEIQGETDDRIVKGIPNILGEHRQTYSGKNTMVFGSGHSAIATINDLVQLKREVNGGSVTWVVRSQLDGANAGACKPSILPGRGDLEAGAKSLYERDEIRLIDSFYAQEVKALGGAGLLVSGTRNGRKSSLEADRIIVATGCRPDLAMTRELQLQHDHLFECALGVSQLITDAEARGEAIPAPHGYRALAHPEPDYFAVGMKSHGRAQNFFLMSGYEQVRSVCAYITGNREEAERVEFEYPEDGVCGGACAEGACCGPATGSGAAAACGAGGGCCG
jgi:hypothetical protein